MQPDDCFDDADARFLASSQWSGCSPANFLDAVAELPSSRAMPPTLVDIGANKGYKALEHLRSWTQQRNLSSTRWHAVMLRYARQGIGRSDNASHGFLSRFGAESVQMIDCRDGKSVHWLTLAHFFAGYLHPWTRALCPDTFRKMMLKLKDWPPDQDFQAKMPEYFEDLMQALPFPQYTRRDGVLNLAKYFPRQYVPPDLGPKMYNAYGHRRARR